MQHPTAMIERFNARHAIRLILFLVVTGLAQGLDEAPDSYQPMTAKERRDTYLREAFWSPAVFFRAAGPALGNHLGNRPPQWEQGAAGYSRRFADRFGRFALQESYEAATAAALRHDVRYHRSRATGFWPRAAHALSSNFVTYNQSGRRVPNVARLGSVTAAEFTATRWMPDGYRGPGRALRGAGLQIGVSSAVNLVREFGPELKRIFRRK